MPIASDNTVCHVIMNILIIVPAASELEAVAQLSAEGGQWLVEGIHHDKLLIARVVVMPSANCIPIRITNTSATPVTLYRGTKVATTESVTEMQ